MGKEMSRRKANSFDDVQYSPLTGINGDDFKDSQFWTNSPTTVPWKTIVLASALCVSGIILLIIGSCIMGGIIDSKFSDRMWPVIILGSLTFIPGAYHVHMAYCAYRNKSGYSFDHLPEFD